MADNLEHTNTWTDPEVVSGKKLWVEMRTPEGAIYSGHASTVRVPGSKSPFGVLPRHAPLMSSLDVGLTYVRDPVGQEWRFVTGRGFVEVFKNRVLLLVDFADDVNEIDLGRAEKARDRARDRLSAGGDIDRARAEASLDRATMRLRFGAR